MSKLFFFRHAQASYGAANYDKLSPKGEEQAAQLGHYLAAKKQHFDKIYVGPLVRQKHTYAIVATVYKEKGLVIPEPIFLKALKEHSGPKVLKLSLSELIKTVPYIRDLSNEAAENPAVFRKNGLLIFDYFISRWVKGGYPIDGLEPWATFRAETRKGLQYILGQTNKGEVIGAFTSGGTISSITAEALDMHADEKIAAINFSVRNTSMSTFLYSKEQFNLLTFNETPHLPDDMLTFV